MSFGAADQIRPRGHALNCAGCTGEWTGSPNPANPDNEWICDECGGVIDANEAQIASPVAEQRDAAFAILNRLVNGAPMDDDMIEEIGELMGVVL
jgi:hypothetical protein